MKKIKDSYASRMGTAVSTLRFLVDGQTVDGDTTPKMLVSRLHALTPRRIRDEKLPYGLGDGRWRYC
jgi:hypothetical protein